MSVLGLGSCKLSTAAAKEIAGYLRSSGVLTSLNLEFNLIDTDGAVALAKALAVSSGLTQLKCALLVRSHHCSSTPRPWPQAGCSTPQIRTLSHTVSLIVKSSQVKSRPP